VKLRTKKRLLNVLSLTLVAGSGAMLWLAWHAEPPTIEVEATSAGKRQSLASRTSLPQASITLDPNRWNRVLRQPLYDPPPPPPPQVIVEQRPITVTLVGTVMEGENSQAFVRQQSGKVDIKRLGEQLTAEAADGVIASITASEIVIRRPDGEHRVAVEGSN
jgi:hypothetical protein